MAFFTANGYFFPITVNELLRAVCCKDQLRSCKIEKTDFLKLRQNIGLGELFLKIQVSGRIYFYFIFCNFFSIVHSAAAKIDDEIGNFPEARVEIWKAF